MTDTTPPLPTLTPADIVEVGGLVQRLAEVFGNHVAPGAAVIVLMDRHGWTRDEAAQRVTLATRALRAARAQIAAARFTKLDLTRGVPAGTIVVTVDPEDTAAGQTSGRTPTVVIIDEVRHIDAA